MSKHITREIWAAAGDFYKAAQPGDTVDEQIVNDFRDMRPAGSRCRAGICRWARHTTTW